jgi:U4/U6.U5 tri-snRNP-associated protein 2
VSKKKFKIIEQGDPVEFMSWLLNTLHYALCAGKRKGKSIVHETFQGEMKIYTRKLPPTENEDEIREYMEREEYQRLLMSYPYYDHNVLYRERVNFNFPLFIA